MHCGHKVMSWEAAGSSSIYNLRTSAGLELVVSE